jgi:propanol-preferring alcohol dehydrogenase
MQLAAGGKPLRLVDREIGKPDAGQLLLRVLACGVCRTDLHIADGELPRLDRPAIPGHEIFGEVIERGARSKRFSIGQRVGVPWLGWTCGDLRLLPKRQGKPMRQRALHRLPDRRRLR